jgi:transcriptional regulator with PAS, ATPase and Fis domain
LYRLLVHDKLIPPLPEDKEDLASLKHRLVMWISSKLPADHELLR